VTLYFLLGLKLFFWVWALSLVLSPATKAPPMSSNVASFTVARKNTSNGLNCLEISNGVVVWNQTFQSHISSMLRLHSSKVLEERMRLKITVKSLKSEG
jgi:hypothetical protein